MNFFLKAILCLLLFFAPFSFAAVEPWAFTILQGGIVSALLLLLLSRRVWVMVPLFKPVLFTLLFMTAYALAQSIAPQTLLETPAFYPATLMRLYTLEHASLFITYLALAFVISQVAPSLKEIRFFALIILLSGLCVALCAACFSHGEYILHLAGYQGGYGPFLNRNHAGVFLGMCTMMTLGYMASSLLDYAKYVANRKTNEFFCKQALLAFVFVGLCVATVFSRSRGGMLSLGATLFVFAFLSCWFVSKAGISRLKYLSVVGGLLTVSLLLVCTHLKEINAFAGRATSASVDTRKALYHSALEIIQDYPLWGIGVGAMPVAITSYMDKPLNHYVERLHNDWLEILLGAGYVGCIPILLGIGWFVWLALKRMRRLEPKKLLLFAALFSTGLLMAVGSGVDFHFFIPACAFLFFVVLGLLCSPSFDKEHLRANTPPPLLKILLFTLCLAACWVPLQKTLAWRAFFFGKNLTPQSQTLLYQQGLAHYPSPRYALRLGLSYYNQSLSPDKTEAEKKALRAQAHALAEQYLRKYPKEKELSQLYILSR